MAEPTQVPTIPPTGAPAPTPAPAPALPSVDWEARARDFESRFKNLQASTQKAVEGHRTEVTGLTTQVAALTTERDGFNTQLTTLQGEHGLLSTEFEAATANAGLQAAELTKLQLISKEAPHLAAYAGFVSHVGLDGAPLDEEGIKANIALLGQVRAADLQSSQDTFREGYVPPVAPVGTQDALPTKEHVAKMLDQTAGVPGKADEYVKWLKVWGTLSNQ